jgi:hypothetical protein
MTWYIYTHREYINDNNAIIYKSPIFHLQVTYVIRISVSGPLNYCLAIIYVFPFQDREVLRG